jgi:uncharacterized membrane protein YdjX (TVP38/TMEM64 family)
MCAAVGGGLRTCPAWPTRAERVEQSVARRRFARVEFSVSEWLPIAEFLTGLSANADWVVASAAFLLAAALMAFGVPGVVIPLSVASGALVSPPFAGVSVALGALVGSQALFLASRRALGSRSHGKIDAFVAKVEGNFRRYGFWYVVGLRLAGAPHFALTPACAVLPIGKGAFAAATLLGLLPVTFLAAALGSSL